MVSRLALIDADWLDIKGFEGFYQVSSEGEVRSLPRKEWVQSKRTGGHYRHRMGRLSKLYTSKNRRKSVGLHKNGTTTVHLIHRLVAEAFIPNPEGKPEVNHMDGNPSNNKKTNLEWCTRRENIDHAMLTGLTLKGSSNGTSKLVETQVLEILERLSLGHSQTHIAESYQVSNHAIHKIAKGENWRWLSSCRKEEHDGQTFSAYRR